MTWDISRLRKISGQPAAAPAKTLTEGGWNNAESDDDEDRDVRIASGDKKQNEFEKKNSRELTAAQKEAKKVSDAKKAAAKKPEAAKAPAKPAEKKAEPAKPAPKAEEKKPEPKAEEKKETPAAEAKRRGKAPNENSFNQQAAKFAKSHTRASFIKWAADTHGKGKNYASALFARYNKKSEREQQVKETWIIVHPQLSNYTLCENREINQLQWIDGNTDLHSMMFATEAEAKKVLKHIQEWKSWNGEIEHIVFEDDETDAAE